MAAASVCSFIATSNPSGLFVEPSATIKTANLISQVSQSKLEYSLAIPPRK